MKIRLLAAVAILTLLQSAPNGMAADKADASAELQALKVKVETKLRDNKRTETDLEPELSEFDALLAKHKGEKTDAVAQILFMKGLLYTQVLNDTAKSDAVTAQLLRDFPDSGPARLVKQEDAAKKLKAALVEGAKFPDFAEKDVLGNPISVANCKAKVVLLDFWATWCPPCRAELPNVIKIYEAYHKQGLEIIGISLDKDLEKLQSYIKEKNMTWPQFCDGKFWENKLAVRYGVQSIPTTYLLDGQGIIIGKDLRGAQLEQAVATALAKK